MFRPHRQLAFAISLSLTSLPIFPTSAQTQPIILVSQTSSKTPPKPPPAPPPDGPRSGGGGLGGSGSSCTSIQKRPTALRPVNTEQRLTTSASPTFWFYIPYPPEEIRVGKFSLLTQDETEYVYQTNFKLPATPGVVSIPIPSSPDHTLEEGKSYRWSLELYCKANTRTKPDLEIYGFIQRVALTPERERQINAGMPDVWYDALTRLANLYIASPQDAALKNDWARLLKSAGLEELAQERLVGSVYLLKNN